MSAQITSTPPPGNYVPYGAPADEIDLRQVWRALMRRKLLIVLFTMLTTLVTGSVALLMTPVYKAEVLLQPVTEQKGADLDGLSGGLGGLAALAGVSLEGLGGKGSVKSVSIATLKSRALTEQFIRDKDLLPILFHNQWDAELKDWRSADTERIPTVQDGYRLFDKKIRKVTDDKKSGLVTLSIEWRDPALAAAWASELVKRTNTLLQDRARDEGQKNVEYLEQQARQTSLLEVRDTIFRLMEKEMNKAMLAKVSDEYAFRVIDPAVIPEKKSKPQRLLMTVLGALAGFFVSVFFVLVSHSFASSEPEPV